MAQLLSEYKDVFSCGEHDMGLTKAGEEVVAIGKGGVLTGGLLCSTCGVSRSLWVAAPSPSPLAPDRALEGDGGGVVTGGILVSTGSASCPL